MSLDLKLLSSKFPNSVLQDIYMFSVLQSPTENALFELMHINRRIAFKVLEYSHGNVSMLLPSVIAAIRTSSLPESIMLFRWILTWPGLVDWKSDSALISDHVMNKSIILELISYSDFQKYDLTPKDHNYLLSEQYLIRFILRNKNAIASTEDTTSVKNSMEIMFGNTSKDLFLNSFILCCRRGFSSEANVILKSKECACYISDEDFGHGFIAASSNNHESLLNLLAGKDNFDRLGTNYIQESFGNVTQKGHISLIKVFLRDPLLAKIEDNTVRTATIAAIKGEKTEIVEILIEHDALNEEWLSSCVKMAGSGGNLDILKLIVSSKKFNNGIGKALEEAVLKGNMEVVEYLLENSKLAEKITDLELKTTFKKVGSNNQAEKKMRDVLVSRASTKKRMVPSLKNSDNEYSSEYTTLSEFTKAPESN